MNQDQTVRFADFGLHPALARGVEEAGFETPRPIQTRAAKGHIFRVFHGASPMGKGMA